MGRALHCCAHLSILMHPAHTEIRAHQETMPQAKLARDSADPPLSVVGMMGPVLS